MWQLHRSKMISRKGCASMRGCSATACGRVPSCRLASSSASAAARRAFAPGIASAHASKSVILPSATKDGGVTSVSTPLAALRASMSAVLLSAAMLAAPMSSTMLPAAHAAAAVEQDISSRAVEEYSELEAQGKMKNVKALEDFRSKYRIRRTMDGRLQVKSSKGEWYSVRLDMEVPGTLLLRDPSGGVYAIQAGSLQQVDLSDDYVCLLMFADGAWESDMSTIDFTDEAGKTKQLKLDEKEFRGVVGLLQEADEWMEGENEGRS